LGMGVWQGVATDSLRFYPGPPCPTLLRPAGEPPLKRLHVVSGMARPQGEQPAAVFYPFGHPMPYAYDFRPCDSLELQEPRFSLTPAISCVTLRIKATATVNYDAMSR
jgi:hypothetical protein